LTSRATCLGCGCACDDIVLRIASNRIVEAGNACYLGAEWFGDGVLPARVGVGRREGFLDEAVAAAAHLLLQAERPLVYLCPDVTCEAQREAIALADALRALVDSVTSSTAAAGILASQERGRAGATLGEIRNRADVVVFWGVDPSSRYPRFLTRYAPEPRGMHVPDGRRSRTVVAVDVGGSRGPADADLRVALTPDDEVDVLMRLRSGAGAPEPLAGVLRKGRYIAIVADAEPDDVTRRDAGRAAELIALAQALNDTTRAALIALRAGGNRSGADAVLVSQTGFPMAVDFSRGFPRYRPYDGAAARLARGEVSTVLVLGSAAAMPANLLGALRGVASRIVIGPRASAGPLAASDVVVDTGMAGIHDAGTALRMDDVPLPVVAALGGPPGAADIVREIAARVRLRQSHVPEVVR
jgi:formylmethanofuran dehydrogenase subunit B